MKKPLKFTQTFMKKSFVLLLPLCFAVSACKTITTPRVVYPDSPVAYQMVSDMIDEETIEHTVKFRNIGQDVISFDYSIADEPNVPHVDCLGPNSGLLENLYPGAEVNVKNPVDRMKDVHITVGQVTLGKRTSDELARAYKPSTVVEESSEIGGAADVLSGL